MRFSYTRLCELVALRLRLHPKASGTRGRVAHCLHSFAQARSSKHLVLDENGTAVSTDK